MTESTVQVTLNLPRLEKGSTPAPDRRATARIQHIFNDLAKDHPGTPLPFQESGTFGDETKAAVIKFQQKHQDFIPPPADGKVGPLTWAKLLERWIALPPHHPVE
jgi:peptidoglycan hydrolase-like protein with peptidoglycan-binding domain